MLLSTEILFKQGIQVEGQAGVIQMASILQHSLGIPGKWLFLVGFWAAAFSSLVGVFQGVPYLFADYISCIGIGSRTNEQRASQIGSGNKYYRLYLIYMAFPCMMMLYVERPIWMVVMYAAVSSLFLPFLALTLLFMNSRVEWMGPANCNSPMTNLLLATAVILFLYLGIEAFLSLLG